MRKLFFAAVSLMFFSSSVFSQSTWNLDQAHSSIGFSVDHMIISQSVGRFTDFTGTISTEKDDFANAKVSITAKTASIDTDNADRDKHLKSDDFFNAEKYPEMTFVSKSFTKTGEKEYLVTGDLTIRDITKTVELKAKYLGQVTDPWGNLRAGFSATGKVNRFDFGLKWNKLLETGGLVVGETVELILRAELIKQK